MTLLTVTTMRENGRMEECVETVYYINSIGIYQSSNGDKYDGQWLDDDRSGKGNAHSKSNRTTFSVKW